MTLEFETNALQSKWVLSPCLLAVLLSKGVEGQYSRCSALIYDNPGTCLLSGPDFQTSDAQTHLVGHLCL